MIISHKYKFIFIKTVKTAGTSIEVFLSQCCGEDDVVTPIWPAVDSHRARNHEGYWNPLGEIKENRGRGVRGTLTSLAQRYKYYNHIPAFLVKQRTNRQIWDSYFKFCVERNPWDKTLSHYHMINDRGGGGLSMDEYLDQSELCLNFHRYTDRSGNLLVDQVVKYETLNDELQGIFNELGVPFDGSLGVRAKSEHRKDRTPYRDVFSEKQRELVQTAFAQEIEMHGYEF